MDPISAKPISKPDTQVASVARAAAPTPVATAHQDTVSAELSLSATAFGFGGKAPVDHDRVAQLRDAIRNNQYPIRADAVADKMLAAKAEWSSK